MSRDETVVPLAEIQRRILTVRGQKVMLDSDLATSTVFPPNG